MPYYGHEGLPATSISVPDVFKDIEVVATLAEWRASDDTTIFNVSVGGDVHGVPLVRDGVVYFGSLDKNVYAADARTGQERWRFGTDGPVSVSTNAQLTLHEGVLYACSYDGCLYALDAGTGRLVWKFPTQGKLVVTPALATATAPDGARAETVYIGSEDRNLYAVTLEGRERWRFQTGGPISSNVLAADGKLYFGSHDSTFYCLAPNGSLAWSFRCRGKVVKGAVTDGSRIFFGALDRMVYALALDGRLLWTFPTQGMIITDPAVADGTVYVTGGDDNIYALDAASGTLRWRFKTNNMCLSQPLCVNGLVVFGSTDNGVYALDAATGSLRWKLTTNGPILASATAADGTIYIGSADCHLYALTLGGEVLWKFKTALSTPAKIHVEPKQQRALPTAALRPQEAATVTEKYRETAGTGMDGRTSVYASRSTYTGRSRDAASG